MNDELKQTVHLIRRGKVTTDDRGRTVWEGPVEEVELELISTGTLKRVLASSDADRRQRLADAAESGDGVLARNTASNEFEIIDDDDLEAALASAAAETGPVRVADLVYERAEEAGDESGEELSLVSTQMLRQMLGADAAAASDADIADEPGGKSSRESGFDPYNSG